MHEWTKRGFSCPEMKELSLRYGVGKGQPVTFKARMFTLCTVHMLYNVCCTYLYIIRCVNGGM
uniref:Uncharacterized protein n=1 Tax=Anguilla anguilla TaxID=7936 RepID=A0A0E9X299_ANGAN